MLERIRDIRSSERRMYLQVRNILGLAADYDAGEEETRQFFQTVQNKLHFAATGKTAPELIAERANHEKPNMGLTAWKGGVVRKGDVTIAKNYLREEEIEELNRITSKNVLYVLCQRPADPGDLNQSFKFCIRNRIYITEMF